MRLLFLTENYPRDRGGMSESCDRIVRGLARAGTEIDLVHFDRRATATSRHATSFGSLTRVAVDADAAHTINLLWNRIEGNAATHVVAFGGTLPLLAAPVFAAWLARPLVTLMRGNELDAGLFDPRRRPILDDALLRSAAVCTVTSTQAERITALHPSVHAHVVGNGIDFELWEATDADRVRAHALRRDRRMLGFFGHLKNKKGVPFFIDVLRPFAESVHLLLVGELDEAVDLEHTLFPPVDRLDLIPYYLASDLVVLPSHYDGFPNVLIEAAALGRPLLASNVGGMRDLLTDGEDAFLFDAGDPHSCREAIARALAADDATLQRMGARAAQVVRERCDARDETRRYVDVLRIAQEEFDAKTAHAGDARPAPRPLPWRAR